MKSIASRLQQALGLIGTIPLALVILVFYTVSIEKTHEEVNHNFRSVGLGIAEDVEGLIRGKARSLEFLTKLLYLREKIVQDFDTDGLLAELLSSFVAENPEFNEVILYKKSSKGLECFSSSEPKRLGIEAGLDGKRLLEPNRADGSLDIRQDRLLVSTISGKLEIPLDVLFVGEDEEQHLLRGLIDLGRVSGHIFSIPILGKVQNEQSLVVVFDRDGKLFITPDHLISIDASSELYSLSKAAREKNREDLIWNGRSWLHLIHESGDLGLRILVMQDSDLAYQWFFDALKPVVWGIPLLLALIMIFSRRLAGHLSAPIQDLSLAAKAIANGDYEISLPEGDLLELNQMSRSFREMMDAIFQARGKLESLNRSLEMKVALRTSELEQKNKELGAVSVQMSKYLSPQIYHQIFEGKHQVNIGSSRKKLTVFFSDIKNFTTISDEMESEDLSHILNQYLDEMAAIALEFGGTIDKFIGDAVMIFFGDPSTKGVAHDAIQCVRMAIAMQKRMRVLRREWSDNGHTHVFHIRCGINTGYCTVGNFGSKDRMDYTIVGRNVNLASRLESNASPDGILISRDCYELVKDSVPCRELEAVTMKGISRPVPVFEVILESEIQKVEIVHDGFSLRVDPTSLNPAKIPDILKSLRAALTSLQV